MLYALQITTIDWLKFSGIGIYTTSIPFCAALFPRIMSFSNIYTMNTWLLLSPSSLCCDWTLGSIPLVTSIADPRNMWAALLYSSIGLLVGRVLRSNRDLMSTGMGVALTMLTFLPASGIVFRVGFVIAERWVPCMLLLMMMMMSLLLLL